MAKWTQEDVKTSYNLLNKFENIIRLQIPSEMNKNLLVGT
jgi:hypothetical protein